MLPTDFKPFEYPFPGTVSKWKTDRLVLRETLFQLLGDLPPLFTPNATLIEERVEQGMHVKKITFENGIGYPVYGYLILPEGRTDAGPALLYHHYHGQAYNNGKEELFKPWITNIPPAQTLTQEGYVVLAIDAYGFVERKNQAPSKDHRSGRKNEEALFKLFLWQGRSLWGMIVRDDLLALNYLLSLPEVDPKRVGATGMSMGSTRTWWLAALDERVKAASCVGCLTRYQNLIQRGQLNQHSIYYYVPGILKEGIDMEAVVSLIAPRPLLTLTGSIDEGSPVDGVHQINEYVQRIYDLYEAGSCFEGKVYEDVGHTYTPEMWNETLRWFERYLKY